VILDVVARLVVELVRLAFVVRAVVFRGVLLVGGPIEIDESRFLTMREKKQTEGKGLNDLISVRY
jgi:hypothetical protein